MAREVTYTDEQAAKLLEDLQFYMSRNGYAQPQMANILDIADSSFNQLLNGKYSGDRQGQLRQIEQFLDREAERAAKPKLHGFVETSAAMQILKCLRNNHVNGTMGAVVGGAGVGKTTAFLEYGRRNPKSILFLSAATWCKSHVQLSKQMARLVLSGVVPRTTQERCEALVQKLRGQARLIIVDQAHQLDEGAHEFLQNLWDHCNQGVDEQRLGIVLGTTHRFYNDIYSESKSYLYEQLTRRISAGMTVQLRKPFSIEDIRSVFSRERLKYQIKGDGHDFLLKVSQGRHGLSDAKSVIDKLQDVLTRKKAPPETVMTAGDLERMYQLMLRAA